MRTTVDAGYSTGGYRASNTASHANLHSGRANAPTFAVLHADLHSGKSAAPKDTANTYTLFDTFFSVCLFVCLLPFFGYIPFHEGASVHRDSVVFVFCSMYT